MKKIIKAILLLILLAAIAFAIWQRENLKVLWQTAFSDPEVIGQELEKVSADTEQKLREEYQIEIPQFTREQTEQLLDGTKTEQEILQELGIEQEKAAASTPTDPSGIVEKYTALLYAYRVELMGKLGGLKQQFINRWNALPAEERNASGKSKFIADALHEGYAAESESDSRVKALLDQMEQELKAIGADTAIRDTLWKQYNAEKAAEKSKYLENYIR